MTRLPTRTAILLVGVSIVLTSCAQLLFRVAMQNVAIGDVFSISETSIRAPDMLFLLTGLALYACSMLAWIFALSRLTVSFAYPLLSLSYVIVYLAAVELPGLEETPSLTKLAGSVVMVLGVFTMALDSIQESRRARKLAGDG